MKRVAFQFGIFQSYTLAICHLIGLYCGGMLSTYMCCAPGSFGFETYICEAHIESSNVVRVSDDDNIGNIVRGMKYE